MSYAGQDIGDMLQHFIISFPRNSRPISRELLGGFASGARVALLWQHNVNPSYKLASILRYDDIVRTLDVMLRTLSAYLEY